MFKLVITKRESEKDGKIGYTEKEEGEWWLKLIIMKRRKEKGLLN